MDNHNVQKARGNGKPLIAKLEIEQGPDVSTLKSLGLRRSILFRGLGRDWDR